MSELPEGWEWATLESLVEILDSMRIPVNRKERDERPGDVPYYGATGQVGTIDDYLFDETLVLLGEDGAPFLDAAKPKAYIVKGKSWVNNHAHVLRSVGGVTTPEFLMHQLNALSYGEYVNGTTRLKLTQKAMRSIRLALPPLAEQRRLVAAIEEHFSRLDAAEMCLRTAAQRSDSLLSALTERAFSGDWPVEPLSSRTVEQRYGSSAKAATEGDVPVLRMGNIQDGRLDYGNLKYLSANHADVADLQLGDGDVLFNRTNSPELVGKSAVFRRQPGPVTFASYLIRVRVDKTLDPEWVSTFINSNGGRRYIDSVVTQQVGQANVNGTKLKNFPIPIPPIEVQVDRIEELEGQRESIWRARSEIENHLARSSALRRSILAAAFSGQLVSQGPSDEPASVLLERIVAERAAPKPSRGKRAAS